MSGSGRECSGWKDKILKTSKYILQVALGRLFPFWVIICIGWSLHIIVIVIVIVIWYYYLYGLGRGWFRWIVSHMGDSGEDRRVLH